MRDTPALAARETWEGFRRLGSRAARFMPGFLFGCAASASILNHIEPAFATDPLRYVFEFAPVVLVVSCLAHLAFPWFLDRIRALPVRQRWGSIGLAAVFGLLVPLAIPFKTARKIETLVLKIRATGRKELQAHGNRIALHGIKVDGSPIDLVASMTRNDGTWTFQGPALQATVLPSDITLSLHVRDHVQCDFGSGQDAGIVETEWQGKRYITSLLTPYAVREVHFEKYERFTLLSSIVYLGSFLLAAVFTLATILPVLSRPEIQRQVRPPGLAFSLSAIAFLVLAWGTVWLAYYPGIMSWDSIYQWGQAQSLEIDDTMPAAHTLFIWAVTRIWNSPAAVTGVQVLVLAGVLAWGTACLIKSGVSRIAAWYVLISFVILPFNTFITIAVWKDVPFGISVLAVMFMLIRIVETSGTWLERTHHQAALSIALCFVALFRHNGLVPALAVTAGLLAAFRNQRGARRVTAFWILLLVLVRGPLYTVLKVQPANSTFLAIPMQNLAALAHQGIDPPEGDLPVLESVMPYELWGASYYPFNFAPVYLKADQKALDNHRSAIVRIWLESAWEHPLKCLHATFAANSFLWRILPASGSYIYLLPTAFEPNTFGLEPANITPRLRDRLQEWLETSIQAPWLNLLWRPALFTYVLLFAGALLALRQGSRWLLIVIPVGSNWAGLLLTAGAQEVRYMYPLFFATPILLALLLRRPARSTSP